MSTHYPESTRTAQSKPVHLSARCPRCSAFPGSPCRGLSGQTLAGVHFQRTGANRRAFAAAIHLLYAPLARSRETGRVTVSNNQ